MAKNKSKSKLTLKKKSEWKRVSLDEGLLARGVPAELVGIEELRDYTLVKKAYTPRIASPKVVKVNSKKAKKLTEGVDEIAESKDSDTKDELESSSEKGSKKKQGEVSNKNEATKKSKLKKNSKKPNLVTSPAEEKNTELDIKTEVGSSHDKSLKKKDSNVQEKIGATGKKNKLKKNSKQPKKKPECPTVITAEKTDADTQTELESTGKKGLKKPSSKRPSEDSQQNDSTKKKLKSKKPQKGPKASKSSQETTESASSDADEPTLEEPENKKQKLEESPETDETPKAEEWTIWQAMFVPEILRRAILELGFVNPTPIQLAVLPTAMKGRKDIVGAAETGSGKTLAFGIPILHGILKDKEFELKHENDVENSEDSDPNDDEAEDQTAMDEDIADAEELDDGEGIGCVRVIDNIKFNDPLQKNAHGRKLRALIVTPTRELAVQIERHLKAIAKYTDITIALVIGGMAAPKQERLLSKGPDIVVGTPGRLWELIEGGNPHLSQIYTLRYLALDETDRLLEKGHFGELHTLLEHINRDEAKKRYRQNFVFSATLTLAHELPSRVGNAKRRKKAEELKLDKLLSMVGVRPKAKIVDLTAKSSKPVTLSEMKLFSATIEDKDYYLYYFLRHHPGRTLVFCNSISNVRRLTSVFTLLDMKPMPLHAQMQQRQRLKHLERFSSFDSSLLIATDVAARGLDIPNIQNVVHFQVPRTSENYVHRSGRTARASRDGLSLMLIEPSETALYRRLCSTLKKDKTDLPDYDIDMRILSAVKEKVNLAKNIEILEHRTKRDRSDEHWVKKMAEEADLLVEDSGNESDAGGEAQAHAQLLKDLKAKRKELTQLLRRPLKRSIN